MRKVITLALVAAAVTLSLAACNDDDSSTVSNCGAPGPGQPCISPPGGSRTSKPSATP